MSNGEKIKITVYINLIFLILALIYVIYAMALLHRALPSPTDARYPEESRRVKHNVVVTAISWTIAVLITVFFNLVLLRGVNQRSYKKCLIWFIFCLMATTIQIYKIVMSFVSMEYFQGGYLLFWACISLYALYIVKCFMKEVRSDSSLQPLTNKE